MEINITISIYIKINNRKERIIMTKEIKILKLQNRITLLSERNKDNGRIIAKLKRQLKNLTPEEQIGG